MRSQRIKRKVSRLSKIDNMSISIIDYKTIISTSLENNLNPFDEIEKFVFLFDFKNPKDKGDFWELFSRDWLLYHPHLKYDNVYLLQDIPKDLQLTLKLRRRGQIIQDNGIDIVAVKGDKYHAIQCKYKREKETLTWRELSTFFSLCSFTGPWEEIIVMTNNSGAMSRKIEKPPNMGIYFRSIFRVTSQTHWKKIAGIYDYKIRFVSHEIKNKSETEEKKQEDESLLLKFDKGINLEEKEEN
jgi:hypothetical protein